MRQHVSQAVGKQGVDMATISEAGLRESGPGASPSADDEGQDAKGHELVLHYSGYSIYSLATSPNCAKVTLLIQPHFPVVGSCSW